MSVFACSIEIGFVFFFFRSLAVVDVCEKKVQEISFTLLLMIISVDYQYLLFICTFYFRSINVRLWFLSIDFFFYYFSKYTMDRNYIFSFIVRE